MTVTKVLFYMFYMDIKGVWRRLRDSNPGRTFTLVGFQDRCIRPLCHSSDAHSIPLQMRSGKGLRARKFRLRHTSCSNFRASTVVGLLMCTKQGYILCQSRTERHAQVRTETSAIVPTFKKSNSPGKPFWRVLVGPAQTSAERSAILKKIKTSDFADAYAVSN